MLDWLAGLAGIIQVVVGFGALIFVHELGHFLVAKWCGVRVDEFSLGFGPYLLTWKKGTTVYALRAIPLGGFVQMRGQLDLDPSAGGDEPDSYNKQSIPKRMAIIVAGVTMNAMFAVVLLVFAFWLPGIWFEKAVIDEPDVGSGAAEATSLGHQEAGLKRGDKIITVDGRAVAKFHEIRQVVALSDPNQEYLDVTVRRKGEDKLLHFRVKPQIQELPQAPGVKLPSLGVRLNRETQQLRLGCTAERYLWIRRVELPGPCGSGGAQPADAGVRRTLRGHQGAPQ